VVSVGETEVEPAETGETLPTPLSIVALVAFVVVHESVEASPALIVFGFAVSVHVGAEGGEVVTVTVVSHVAVPPFPFTVSTYFVVAVGCTVTELSTVATGPMPAIEPFVVPVEVHESCAAPPGATVAGLAEITQVGGGTTGAEHVKVFVAGADHTPGFAVLPAYTAPVVALPGTTGTVMEVRVVGGVWQLRAPVAVEGVHPDGQEAAP
jgi:hypothetical protein